MPIAQDAQTLWLMAGVFGFLTIASAVGYVLGRRTAAADQSTRATVANLNARLRAWWVIVTVCAVALLLGRTGACVLFGLASFWALREFITLTPTRPGDHRALFWVFFVITPLQYVLVAVQWYGLFIILIPVYAFLFIPVRMALCGEYEHFLERAARTQWGLMICVYCVSHAPALLTLPLANGGGPKLLLFFLLIVQLSDVFQYIWGKLLGRHQIAPRISPKKTWEGFVGGIGTATALGTALWWATPFNPWQAAGMSLTITLLGFAGGLVMSAIKRDRGVKDYGTLIEGHGGVLDRIDSICFAAPVFFHLTRYFFT
jgi:phosphatidate cytidylyltransferase